ncbi:hypothetical protein RJ60_03915 [Mesotoga sp. B105.6.4]|nr:hypothetical protein RJ60_03915 [Mesotoga sp. B105.6.4]
MPGEASGDAMLPSAGGDFEDCLFAQTSFGFARPIRSIEKEHGRDVRYAHEKTRSENKGLTGSVRTAFLALDLITHNLHLATCYCLRFSHQRTRS